MHANDYTVCSIVCHKEQMKTDHGGGGVAVSSVIFSMVSLRIWTPPPPSKFRLDNLDFIRRYAIFFKATCNHEELRTFTWFGNFEIIIIIILKKKKQIKLWVC